MEKTWIPGNGQVLWQKMRDESDLDKLPDCISQRLNCCGQGYGTESKYSEHLSNEGVL